MLAEEVGSHLHTFLLVAPNPLIAHVLYSYMYMCCKFIVYAIHTNRGSTLPHPIPNLSLVGDHLF